MRYSREHKARTRERILRAAAPLFRRHGFEAVTVDALMEEAGLTRGGFYAHFASKEDLLAEVMAADTGLVRMLRERKGSDPEVLSRQAVRILSDYLAPEHRDEVAAGCPLASMAGDAARGPDALRHGYAGRFQQLVRELQRGRRGSRGRDADAIVAAILAVGGVLIARTFDDDEEATRIERACQRQIRRLLAQDRPS